jgi:pimeloyl-ACP methyl ester carboxylesterase
MDAVTQQEMRLTPPALEGTIRVRSERRLGFASFGSPESSTIVWLHGTPGARRQVPEMARRMAEESGIRFIGVDRPGTGWSTSHLYDSVLDFTTDLEIVLDELGVAEAAVIGLSGGGPYALAAAYAMPERVRVVGVLSGVAPTQGLDAPPGGLVAFLARFAPIYPPLRTPLTVILGALTIVLRPIGHQALLAYARVAPPGDRSVLHRPDIEAMFLDDLFNTHGRLQAPINDVILFARDWGFSLRDVRVPVKWWHGDADHFVPLSHGRHCVELLPCGELFVRPGESHLGGFGATNEVLQRILAAWDRTPAPDGETSIPPDLQAKSTSLQGTRGRKRTAT